jgi:hypothetical protein
MCASQSYGALDVVEELIGRFTGALTPEIVAACASRVISDLDGSVSAEALPEMAVRLAEVRLVRAAGDARNRSARSTATWFGARPGTGSSGE